MAEQNAATKAGFNWDKLGYGVQPDLIRFSASPGDSLSIEIEFLMHGEAIGRTFEVGCEELERWLAVRGNRMTSALQEAIDFGFAHGDTVYFTKTDTYVDLIDERHQKFLLEMQSEI